MARSPLAMRAGSVGELLENNTNLTPEVRMAVQGGGFIEAPGSDKTDNTVMAAMVAELKRTLHAERQLNGKSSVAGNNEATPPKEDREQGGLRGDAPSPGSRDGDTYPFANEAETRSFVARNLIVDLASPRCVCVRLYLCRSPSTSVGVCVCCAAMSCCQLFRSSCFGTAQLLSLSLSLSLSSSVVLEQMKSADQPVAGVIDR